MDLNYARGMFSDDGNIKDYVTQRDLDMLESTGMPYDDFMSAANSMLTEQGSSGRRVRARPKISTRRPSTIRCTRTRAAPSAQTSWRSRSGLPR